MTLRTPARVCLFGDHQDYLGLPIIACAINRYMRLEATPNFKDYFHIQLPDLGEDRKIYFNDHLKEPIAASDFFLSGLKVIQRNGATPFEGYDIQIKSTIPINAGVSSSSALVVSWMHFLIKAFRPTAIPSAEEIAQWAYEAEVVEHGSPGGKMDQYSIALGNVLYLETGSKLHFEVFEKTIPGLILVESGIPKETIGTLGNVRGKTMEAIQLIKMEFPEFELQTCSLKIAQSLVSKLPGSLQDYFLAAIENHEITQEAKKLLDNIDWDFKHLGDLMYQHHSILRDRLKVSHPKIDAFIETALQIGAYGGKIVGSGGGGCAVIIAPENRREEIIQALKKQGAKAAYSIKVSQGTHVE